MVISDQTESSAAKGTVLFASASIEIVSPNMMGPVLWGFDILGDLVFELWQEKEIMLQNKNYNEKTRQPRAQSPFC